MRIHPLTVGPLQGCCYVVAPDDQPDAAIIDPGGEAARIAAHIRRHQLTPRLLLATHGHIDHVQAVAAMKDAFPGARLCIHEADAPMLSDAGQALADLLGLPFEPCEPDGFLADGDALTLASLRFEVLHTPGHTPGGICLLIRREEQPAIVFSGDTLFAGGIGRTDFPGGSYVQLLDSIRGRLFRLPDDTLVYPGHGDPTTIGEERRTNPFLR